MMGVIYRERLTTYLSSQDKTRLGRHSPMYPAQILLGGDMKGVFYLYLEILPKIYSVFIDSLTITLLYKSIKPILPKKSLNSRMCGLNLNK